MNSFLERDRMAMAVMKIGLDTYSFRNKIVLSASSNRSK